MKLDGGKFVTFDLRLFCAVSKAVDIWIVNWLISNKLLSEQILKNSMGYLSMLMAMKDKLVD